MPRSHLPPGLLLILLTFSCGDGGTAAVTVVEVDIDFSLPEVMEGGAALTLSATAYSV